MKLRATVLIATCLSTAGCTTIVGDWRQEVTDQVGERSGGKVSAIRSSDDVRAAEAKVAALLCEPVTAERAVQVALLNNRSVQALFAGLGVARGELLRAGVFANPVLDADIRFLESGVQVEAGLVQSVLNIVFVPLRKRVAEEEFEAEKARVTAAVVGLAAEVRMGFVEYLAALQAEEVRERVSTTAALSADLSTRLHRAGNVTDLDHFAERAEAEEARLELAASRERVVLARERMNDLMGLWGAQVGWRTAGRLPEPSGELPSVADVERRAVEASLELRAGSHAVEAAARRAGFASWASVFDDVHIGGSYERDPDGEQGVGPAFSIPIPFFNWGGPERFAAESEFRRREHELYATAVRVRAMARAAWGQVQASARRVEQLKLVVLPLRAKVTGETQKQYNAMLVGGFDLFAAKRREIEAGIGYVEALRDYWSARADLDRILAGVTGSGMWAASGVGHESIDQRKGE